MRAKTSVGAGPWSDVINGTTQSEGIKQITVNTQYEDLNCLTTKTFIFHNFIEYLCIVLLALSGAKCLRATVRCPLSIVFLFV